MSDSGNSKPSKSNNLNFIVERYLDQVKIITALATTLLITPNLFLTILDKPDIITHLNTAIPCWETILLITNILFILSILATYLIYSSIVGSLINKDKDLIYRPFTRIISILQFVFLSCGCIGLLVIFQYSL